MRLVGIILFSSLFTSGLWGQEQITSPFNTISLEDTSNYSFIVSGHFYGSDKNQSGLPANTLLGNLDWINEQNPQMLICLGDLFKDVRTNIPNYQRVLFDKLETPLFNAVGNHDLSENIYQENFGETDFSFRLGDDIHLFLDTETSSGSISKSQHDLIKTAAAEKGINNIFIYSHRTIWKEGYSEMDALFTDNTQSLTNGNFKDETLPYLKEISESINIFWMSGSLGTAPASFFYHKDANITYIATAIRELPRDAVLKVSVSAGQVSFETHSLTGETLESLEEYDIDFWSTTSTAEPFNYKLSLYYIQLMITHRFFWYGVLWTAGGVLFLWFFVSWRKKRRLRKMSKAA